MNKKSNYKFYVFCIIISLILIEITIYRAIKTGITYDEAYTYMEYVTNKPMEVFASIFKEGTLANNHILNTFFISIISKITNIKYNEFLIRVPNIIFYIVYLYFACKICSHKKYKYSAFLLLTFNYGLNEFAGLGRGYCMATALVLGGIYYFDIFIKDNDMLSLTKSYIFLLFSCYANTVSLIAFFTIIVLSFISLLKRKRLIEYIKKYILHIFIIAILTLLVIKYHFMVSSEGLPLYGGETSFYEDVIKSLFITYGLKLNYINYFVNICIMLLIIIISRNFEKTNYMNYVGLLLLIILMIITKLTGKPWITGRSLLPFMPIIIISIIDIIELLKFDYKYLCQIIIMIPLLVLFFINLDVNKTREWENNYPLRSKCYQAINNDEIILTKEEKENATTIFYRKKIILEYNYDIFSK